MFGTPEDRAIRRPKQDLRSKRGIFRFQVLCDSGIRPMHPWLRRLVLREQIDRAVDFAERVNEDTYQSTWVANLCHLFDGSLDSLGSALALQKRPLGAIPRTPLA